MTVLSITAFVTNNAVRTSDYIASNARMISEYSIGKNMEASTHGLIWGTITTFACRGWGKSWRSSDSIESSGWNLTLGFSEYKAGSWPLAFDLSEYQKHIQIPPFQIFRCKVKFSPVMLLACVPFLLLWDSLGTAPAATTTCKLAIFLIPQPADIQRHCPVYLAHFLLSDVSELLCLLTADVPKSNKSVTCF